MKIDGWKVSWQGRATQVGSYPDIPQGFVDP